ncbi:MAG: zinc-dependent alcohol dehydrogenase family protein [Lachnospiraceae bacterium]|jgi:2-desacetyl-2-hydroxyethyl bacteriochlorophyllide A dehydrogenase|nr:zinc-dependent alcohol dehydrogenase family protein [Lachnospiraceae bacterium]RKJ48703.1 alcohol dehydrogenase [bacterium 1XD42-54]
MKALYIEKENTVYLKDVEVPQPQPDELLIKVAASGFCGSDIHILKGGHVQKYPVIPGHEFSGVVEAVGSKVMNFKVGDRVSADPNVFCENCDACKSNHQIHCKNLSVLGSLRDGAFAEYVTVPERCAFHIGDLDFIQASMAEPLGCVINSHNKYEIPIGSTVLIMGAGTIGLMQMMLSKKRGAARVVMTDIKETQLEKAKELGADFTVKSEADVEQKLRRIAPEGFDIVIDATGVPKCVEMGIRLVKYAGKMIVFGACPVGSQITVDPFDIYFRDLQIIGSYALEKTLGQAIAMLQSGALDLRPLVGQVVSLEESVQVFRDFADGKTSNKLIVSFFD